LSNKNFRVVNYGLEQGLSQSSIFAFEQDDQGYLWIATQSGLNRFNGVNFKVFNHDPNDKNSLPNASITSLYFDHGHKLWIGSESGLSFFDTKLQKFIVPKINFGGRQSERITHIYPAANDNLWVINKSGLWLFDPKTLISKNISIGDSEKKILLMAFDNKGTLWFYKNGSLFETNKNTVQNNYFTRFKLLAKNLPYCNNLKFINNKLWLLCEGKIFIKTKNNDSLTQVDIPLGKNNINFINIVIQNEHIWIATDHGLFHRFKSQKKWQQFTSNPLNKNALPSNLIYRLFIDRHNLLWIGTFSAGMSMWDPNFQYIDSLLKTDQLSKFTSEKNHWTADVTGISLSSDNHIFASTRGAGVFEMDQAGKIIKQWTSKNTKILPTNLILNVLVDKENRLWFSTESYGIFFRNKSGEWKNFVDEKFNSNERYILDVFQDSHGRILVGAVEGLFLFDEKKNRFKSLIKQLPQKFKDISLRFSKIFESSTGDFWFATDGGLILMDKDLKFKTWFNSEDAPYKILNREVNDISEDKFGNIWIATSAGINKIFYLDNNWHVFSYNNIQEIKGKSYYAIQNDDSGFVWIAGIEGIFKLNPTLEEVFKIPLRYGLQSLEFNPNSENKDEQGNLYFGGIKGLNVIHPNKLKFKFFKPKVILKEFNADGKPIQFNFQQNAFIIPDTTKYIRVEFDTVDLANAKNIELRIRIPKLSKTWSPWTKQHHFNFYDLKKGDYEIQAQTKIIGHQNLLTQKNYSLTIETSINYLDYITWILMSLGAIVIFWGVNTRYKKWKEQKLLLINDQLRLEETLKETELELNEKNDEYHLLLDELSSVYRDKELVELQIQELHLVDKQTGLHSRDFIKYSIDNTIRQFGNVLENKEIDDRQLTKIQDPPHLLFLIIKIDSYEKLRMQGGQFLLNKIVIQLAAEIQKIGGPVDELVRWNNDCFLFYARIEEGQELKDLCQRICQIFRNGSYGPSENEKIAISCSIAAIEYPFCEEETELLSWPSLVELAESASKWHSENFEDGWLIICPAKKQGNRQIITKAKINFEKSLNDDTLKILSSKSIV